MMKFIVAFCFSMLSTSSFAWTYQFTNDTETILRMKLDITWGKDKNFYLQPGEKKSIGTKGMCARGYEVFGPFGHKKKKNPSGGVAGCASDTIEVVYNVRSWTGDEIQSDIQPNGCFFDDEEEADDDGVNLSDISDKIKPEEVKKRMAKLRAKTQKPRTRPILSGTITGYSINTGL